MLGFGGNLVLLFLMFSGLRRYKNVELHGLWHFVHHQVS